jgi:hypothetical protein
MVYFCTKNPHVGKFWRILQLEDVGLGYGHLVHFTASWSILWPFCIFAGHLVYFFHFGMLYEENLATLI